MIAKTCIAVRYEVVRQGWRWTVSLTTQLQSDGNPARWVRLRNVSTTGFMAECPHRLRTGQKVHIVLPGKGAVPAEVRWSDGERIGCRFEQRLGPIVVAYEILCTARDWLLSKI